MPTNGFGDDGYADYWDSVIAAQSEAPPPTHNKPLHASVEHPVVVQRDDVDASGACSPIAVWRWFEQAEGALLDSLGLEAGFCARLLIVRQELDYLRSMRHTDRVRIRLSIADVGRSSVRYQLRVAQDEKVNVSGHVVCVLTEARTRRAEPWTSTARTLLTRSAKSEAQPG